MANHETLIPEVKGKAMGMYVTGLEPGNTFPANRSYERKMGRLPKIGAGETISYQLEYSLLTNPKEVKLARARIDQLNKGRSIKWVKKAERWNWYSVVMPK